MKRYFIYSVLTVIILLSLILRTYKLDKTPPSLSWDETSFAYNAYTIASWGIDEWGVKFPVSFKAFGEYKSPVDIYITSIFFKLSGFNDLTTRLPAAFFGVMNVLLLFYLVLELFKRKDLALLSSFLLAISPFNIQFSRHHHELNIALFFYLTGLLLFFKAIRNRGFWIILTTVFFILSFFTYNAAKIIIPITSLMLLVLYWKELLKIKKYLLVSTGILLTVGILFIINPSLSGTFRLKQTLVGREKIVDTYSYKIFKREKLAIPEAVLKQYPLHFTSTFLFNSGDVNPRHSSQTVGEFYRIEAIFLIIGFIYSLNLIFRKRSKEMTLVFVIAGLALIPSSLTNEAPHAARSMFITGSWHIFIALGIIAIFDLIKNRLFKIIFCIALIAIYLISSYNYLDNYYCCYSKSYSSDWQYGYKKIFSDYSVDFEKYENVYVSDKLGQPYIFALYYLRYDPLTFSNTVTYNPLDMWGFSNVKSFSNFKFSDQVNNFSENSLIFAPKRLDGKEFKFIDTIKNLDGSDVFWVYTK